MNYAEKVGFPFEVDFDTIRVSLSDYGIMSILEARDYVRSGAPEFFYVVGAVCASETTKRFGKSSTKFILIDDTSSTVLTVEGSQSDEFQNKVIDGDNVVAKLTFKDQSVKVIGLHQI